MPTQAPLDQMKKGTFPRGFQSQEPHFEKFENEGTIVSGKLLRIDMIEVNGKDTPKFTVDEGPDGITQFLGTADINAKLRREHVGHEIFVRFVGKDHGVVKNNNPMRLFDVAVKPLPEAQKTGPITDEDVPEFLR